MASLHRRGKKGIYHILYRDENGKQKSRSLKTTDRKIAEQFRLELEYRMTKKQFGQSTDISIKSLHDEYLEYSKSMKAESTYKRSELPRSKRFVQFLTEQGLKSASEITAAHCKKYQKQLTEELSPNSVRHTVFVASGMLSFAVESGYLDNNVMKNIKKVKVPKNPPRYLSFDEWGKVRKIAEETYLWPLVITAYYSGLRNSELRFLEWDDFNFNGGLITLRNKPGLGFSLKSHQTRTIPLNNELKKILEPYKKEKGFCFKKRNGDRFNRDSQLSREFKKNIVMPSELDDFSLHTLRHTFASHHVINGTSIFKVSKWLGHQSVNTTMIYAHLAPQDEDINAI